MFSVAVCVLLIAVSSAAIFSASWYLHRVPQVHASAILAPPRSDAELAAQAELDEWCAPRLRSAPTTEQQIKRTRIVIAVDPPCHKQARVAASAACMPSRDRGQATAGAAA